MIVGLLALLRQDVAVQQVLGTRIYPLVPPKNAPGPYALYQVITDPTLMALNGPVNFRKVRLQFSTWSQEYGDAVASGKAIRAVLDGFAGPFSDGTLMQGICCDEFHDAYNSSALLFGTQADYIIPFSNPNPDL